MKLTCTNCGTSGDLALFLAGDDALDVLRLHAQLPPLLAKPMLAYLGLFKPASRSLTPSRAARVLGELLPMIQAQEARRDGISFRAPHSAWAAAITVVLDRRDKLTLPLASNGYLLEVLAAESQRGVKDAAQPPPSASAPATRNGRF